MKAWWDGRQWDKYMDMASLERWPTGHVNELHKLTLAMSVAFADIQSG